MDKLTPKARVYQWLQEAVVGLNLCPFAKPYTQNDSIKVFESSKLKLEDALAELMDYLEKMDSSSVKEISNLLVVYSDGFCNFNDFLDLIDTALELLESSHFNKDFQFAYFHPDFQFEDSSKDSKANYTARSPYPVMHILRSDLVESARETNSDINQIPEINVKRVSSLDEKTLKKLFLDK